MSIDSDHTALKPELHVYNQYQIRRFGSKPMLSFVSTHQMARRLLGMYVCWYVYSHWKTSCLHRIVEQIVNYLCPHFHEVDVVAETLISPGLD